MQQQPAPDPAVSISTSLHALQEHLKAQLEDLDFPSGAELHVRLGFCWSTQRPNTPSTTVLPMQPRLCSVCTRHGSCSTGNPQGNQGMLPEATHIHPDLLRNPLHSTHSSPHTLVSSKPTRPCSGRSLVNARGCCQHLQMSLTGPILMKPWPGVSRCWMIALRGSMLHWSLKLLQWLSSNRGSRGVRHTVQSTHPCVERFVY